MKAFDKTKFHDNFFFIMKKMNVKNMHPIKLLSKALSLGDRSMYRTTKPIVPKIIIDNINCIFRFHRLLLRICETAYIFADS
jgi:hypothetical protein